MFRDRVLGSLGRRSLMTSTQEPNTIAPQSAFCICSRKWKANLIVPACFGTKTSKFGFKIISFSSLESELSFESGDSEINFHRARLPTVNSLLGTLRAICNIQDNGEFLFADELLRNGNLANAKWSSRKTKSRKENSRTAIVSWLERLPN